MLHPAPLNKLRLRKCNQSKMSLGKTIPSIMANFKDGQGRVEEMVMCNIKALPFLLFLKK